MCVRACLEVARLRFHTVKDILYQLHWFYTTDDLNKKSHAKIKPFT
jgi:hypothetical protein